MLNITSNRRAQFLEALLTAVPATIGFADVGSGGPLKQPWSLLPAKHVRKFDFEPTDAASDGTPLCISNRVGRAPFHVARDERGSSFHAPVAEFVARFDMPSLLTARTIEVECTTLDEYFKSRMGEVDAMDVNVEGHDFQALAGADALFTTGFVKLLKVEFETAAIWEGQGWLSDIDPWLRARGYAMAGIDIDFVRAANARSLFHRGEPVWGKALYVPGAARWARLAEGLRGSRAALEEQLVRAIALYVAADLPGHALDALELGAQANAFTRLDAAAERERIAGIYRFAKLEAGLEQLAGLVRRALGRGAAHA